MRLSIIIPLLSESVSVERCLAAALRAVGPDCELILVDGGLSGIATRMVERSPERRDKVVLLRCTEQRRFWTLMRMGVERARGRYILFASIHEWIEPANIPLLVDETETLGADALQARKMRKIRRLSVKEQQPQLPLHEAVDGDMLREMAGLSGEERLITPCYTDKIWRKDLLAEALRLDFTGSWGTGEILNFHYFRFARSVAFTDTVVANSRWSAANNTYSYRRLEDVRRVYEVKMLVMQGAAEGLTLELRAHLVEYIRCLIFRLGWTREAVLFYLRPQLADRFWLNAGIDSPLEDLVDEAMRNHKKNSFKNLLKLLTV